MDWLLLTGGLADSGQGDEVLDVEGRLGEGRNRVEGQVNRVRRGRIAGDRVGQGTGAGRGQHRTIRRFRSPAQRAGFRTRLVHDRELDLSFSDGYIGSVCRLNAVVELSSRAFKSRDGDSDCGSRGGFGQGLERPARLTPVRQVVVLGRVNYAGMDNECWVSTRACATSTIVKVLSSIR